MEDSDGQDDTGKTVDNLESSSMEMLDENLPTDDPPDMVLKYMRAALR